MSSSRSADEVRADHVQAMGPELGAPFHRLSNELIWLCWRWHEYVELFGKSPERLEILNASSPFFFRVVQETLWYETLLGISRLAGPTRTAGKENLSVRRLVPLISSSALRDEVANLTGKLDAVTAFAMEWRNKYIAHRDFGVAMGKPATSLPAATRAEVEAAVGTLADLLNAVQRELQGSTTAYRFGSLIHGAESLLYVLRDGLGFREMREKYRAEGVVDESDLDETMGPL